MDTTDSAVAEKQVTSYVTCAFLQASKKLEPPCAA